MDDDDVRQIKRWFSMGDLITIVVLLVALVSSYSDLKSEQRQSQDDIQEIKLVIEALRDREITPGAERRIAVLETQQEQMRVTSQQWRDETRQQLDRIEQKLDDHMNRR